MEIRLYQIDAFANRPFEGNPAAVCPLDSWLEDSLLQRIAQENNLSETAFFIPSGEGFALRWFTPKTEVDLCGHATLAAAFVLFESMRHGSDEIVFDTRSGKLAVAKSGSELVMDFPKRTPRPCAAPGLLYDALGARPANVLEADDFIAVFENESEILAIAPDFQKLAALERRGVAVTARGIEHDFVSRFFAPKLGIDEDPVTGSAHVQLAPYWSEALGKSKLRARQLSGRGGEIGCEVGRDRVRLSGRAVKFMEGVISI